MASCRFTAFFFSALTLTLWGCSSEGPNTSHWPAPGHPMRTGPAPAPSASSESPAKAPGIDPGAETSYFDETVFPSLQASCAGCHEQGPGPQLFGGDAKATYTTFVAMGLTTMNSMLLSKGQHEGPALTSQQETIVSTWLDGQNEQ